LKDAVEAGRKLLAMNHWDAWRTNNKTVFVSTGVAAESAGVKHSNPFAHACLHLRCHIPTLILII